MDRDTRNLIQRATQDARRLLEREFREQLEGIFDIHVDSGEIAPEPGGHLDDRQRFIRAKMVMAIQHERAKCGSDAAAAQAYQREAAFTTLNRFAALKMMEARKIVLECVSRGEQSGGFKEFTGLAPGLATLPDHGYRLYLECLFDEIGTELGVLFDRRDSASLLWPRRQALTELLEILNRPELAAASIWVEDETIGWVYQYFNDDAERKQMREESAAPRNSRELAVRNQFFTPRYVVEFLTDNTLGRIWYEMNQGQTRLKDQCRYLVRRPDEIFLAQPSTEEHRASQAWLQTGTGQRPDPAYPAHAVRRYANPEETHSWAEERIPLLKPDTIASLPTQELLELVLLFNIKDRFCDGTLDALQNEIELIYRTVEERSAKSRRTDLSQEELLKSPVFIPFRPIKDPRTILMLDPACGSMHFGLFAFDLFEVIYEEYWDLTADNTDGTDGKAHESASSASSAVEKPLRQLYSDKAAFLRDVPRLIIEHNIHGIDIDPRAVQIAGLSLWLRAQKSWQRLGLKPAGRPTIKRSNVVCAEPMPGEAELLREFVEQEFSAGERPVFAHLLTQVFEQMKLAGEAGSLLKIEEEIRTGIEAAKKLAQAGPKYEQGALFGDLQPAAQKELRIDFTGITDEQFWERAEDQIYDALRHYAEQAEASAGFHRRLFAEDAARGFAFIDVCRKRYDVALMNPPFGEVSKGAKDYISATFKRTKNDLYAVFIERFLSSLTENGALGAITSRSGFFLRSFDRWREELLLKEVQPLVVADLGEGVLDSAMVETAAYCLHRHTNTESVFFRLLSHSDKDEALKQAISTVLSGAGQDDFVFRVNPASFSQVPGAPFAYWVPNSVLALFRQLPALENKERRVGLGLSTKNDVRFVRTHWEVSPESIGRSNRWSNYANGSIAVPFYWDHATIVLSERDFAELTHKSAA